MVGFFYRIVPALCLVVLFGGGLAYALSDQARLMVRILPPLLLDEDGAVDYYALAVSPVVVAPRTSRARAESIYEVKIPIGRTIPAGGTISLLFPSGFQFSKTCSTPLVTPENEDINGSSPGTVSIASLYCNGPIFRITVTLEGSAQERDYVHFFLQGIINANTLFSSVAATEYTVGIETRDANNELLGLTTSLPFFLTPAGNQSISGAMFNDNGAGLFGFARDGIKSGSEPALPGVQVCLGGANGSQCSMTDERGEYVFVDLSDGYYSVFVPPLTSGAVVGGPFYVDVQLSNYANRANLNFAFVPSERTITVTVSSIPAGADLDVFASGDGGHVIRELVWNGSQTRTIDLPVSDGAWSVGVEPLFLKDPSLGSSGISSVSFSQPQSQQITVSGDGVYAASFPLRSTEKNIFGKIVDGKGGGIPNVFVLARPSVLNADFSKEVATKTRVDGSFELKVASGQYMVEASMPGMPPVKGVDVTVRDDTENQAEDGNATADIYSKGVLIVNDGDGGSDNLIIVVAKGERAISGRVLDESGGPIAYGYVSAEEIDESGQSIGAFVESPTDSAGSFTLFVFDGRWKVRAVASGYGEIPSKAAVVSGKNLVNQDMRVSVANLGVVKGAITKGGKAVSGAFVSIYGPAGGNSATTDTNGMYSVRVKAGSGYVIDANVVGAGRISPIENVTVGAGATINNQDFIIETSGTIKVTIPGVTDALVDVHDVSGGGDSTSLNPTPGEYSLLVPAGIYTVTAQSTQFGTLGERKNVQVQAGKVSTISFYPPSSFAVTGKIVSSASACVGGATISVVDVINGRAVEDTTDSAGVYSLVLSSGTYALTAAKPGCVDVSLPASFIVTNKPKAIDDRRLEQATASVSGRVLLSDRNVTMETKVVAESSTGSIRSASVNVAALTGKNYTIDLLPGTWKIFSRADGYESSKHTVVIDAEKTLNMTLAAISGYVATERVMTPIAPARGGIVKNNDAGTKFAVVIPAGALGSSSDSGSISTKVTTAVVAKTATAEVVGGKGIEITPKDSSGKPITTLAGGGGNAKITVPYSKGDVAALGIDEKRMMLAVWSEDKQQWTSFSTVVDTVNATLSGVPPHFSVFAPIVPSAPAAPPAQAEPEASQESFGIGSAPAPGTVLPSPAAPLVRQEALEQGKNDRAEEKEEIIMRVTEPSVVFGSTVVKDEGSVEKDVKETVENDSTQQAQVKTIKPRFPIRRVALAQQTDTKKTRLSDQVQQPQSTKASTQQAAVQQKQPELFEISIAVWDEYRSVDVGGTVAIRGEVIKSASEKEIIPLHFTVQTTSGRVIADMSENMTIGRRAVFEKIFTLTDDMRAGYYTVTVDASYRGDSVSSSDNFQIKEQLVAMPNPRTEPQSLPDTRQNVPLAVGLLSFVVAIIVGVFVLALRTIGKLLH